MSESDVEVFVRDNEVVLENEGYDDLGFNES